MSKKKILYVGIVLLFLFFAIRSISISNSESKNYEVYAQGLEKYGNNSYSEAFRIFGKVSGFSKLKQAALYRQALCAEKLGDKKAEMTKYKQIIRHYSTSVLALKAKYNQAQLLFENGNYKSAEKEFIKIQSKNSQSDYAIASHYYLGAIEVQKFNNTKSKKKKLKIQKKAIVYFKTYLKEAPKGRYALGCVQKWLSLGRKLNNEDNLIIAKVYQDNHDYKSSKKFLNATNLSVSWPYLVQNAYAEKNYSKVKQYTEAGLGGKENGDILINEKYDDKSENQNIYNAIDIYLKISDSPKLALSYLLSLSSKSKGYDYLLYKNCNNLPISTQTACFNTLYIKYPNGQFAAEALANIFYDKVKSKKYFMAKKLGRTHLSKFSQTNSGPKVMFWLAKIAERTKNYEESRSYYKALIRRYPDDYYAYRSFLSLNRFKHFGHISLSQKPVEFPYKDSNYGIITELVKVKDYGLISLLSQNDRFIQSWLAYLQGDFSNSARVSRDAIDKMSKKPDASDPRWRLVYPIHYYKEIIRDATFYDNDPILILSIIREESYFNPNAQSHVGASGLMQLMPATAREAALVSGQIVPNDKMRFDVDTNIKLGNVYFSRLKGLLNGKDTLAVLAYNGGIGSVSKWKDDLSYTDIDDFIEQIPYPETQNYLKKVYRSYWNYLRVYNGIKS